MPLARVYVWLAAVTTLLLMSLAHAAGPVQVQFDPDVRLSGDQPYTEAFIKREPSMAANLKNPQNVVAFYMDMNLPHPSFRARVAYTNDGGASWTHGSFAPSKFGNPASVDPVVVSDAQGNFWFAYADGDDSNAGYIIDANISVARSSDGGQSFDTYSVAVPGDLANNILPDKPYLAVDAGAKSKFRGTLYLSYGGDFSQLGYKINVVVSRDGGQRWSPPVTVSRVASIYTDDYIIGSLPLVAPDGTAYVFYADGNGRTGPMSIKFVKSTDGGRRWSAPADAAANLPSPVVFNLKNANPQFGIDPGAGILVTSIPTGAVAPDGTVFIAWVDFPNGRCVDLSNGGGTPTCYNADVRMTRSRDGGKTWSPPVKVTDEVGDSDQFFPWMAAHPDGLVSLMWSDRRLDPDNIDYNIFYTNTRDGVSLLPNLRASSATSPVSNFNGNVFGDYNGIAGTSDAVYLVWGDMRDGLNAEVYAVKGILLR